MPHIVGHVVKTTQPPGGSIGRQPTTVQFKMTLRPSEATPVNRSRSLAQVWPPRQFSGLELRNRDEVGPGRRMLMLHSKQTWE